MLQFPSAGSVGTSNFWSRLEDVFREMGYDVYCGPSYVRAGHCAPGKHPHGKNSRHWPARAVDIGYDPANKAPESNYEKGVLDVTVRMMNARYPLMHLVWNLGPGNHRDHAHFDDLRMPGLEGKYTGQPLPNNWLGFGSRGARVVSLQRLLGIKDDGVFGLGTFDTLRAAQDKAGLRPDGLAGDATFRALTPKPVVPPAKPTPAPQPAPQPKVPSIPIKRVAGNSRFLTNIALVDQIGQGGTKKVYVCNISDNPPDNAVVASLGDGVIFGCSPSGMTSTVLNKLVAYKPTSVVIVGGTTVVSDTVLRQVESAFTK